MLFALITIFITILGGFAGIGAFLWTQFGKIHAMLSEIREGYVRDEECRSRQENCSCTNGKMLDEFKNHIANRKIHKDSKN